MNDLVLIAGSSHKELAEKISQRLGIKLGKCQTGKFSNKETSVQVLESVRDMHVFIIQTSCDGKSNLPDQEMRVNDYLMEMLILVSATKMASARKVTVIIPSFPYSRQPDHPTTTHRNGLIAPQIPSFSNDQMYDRNEESVSGISKPKLPIKLPIITRTLPSDESHFENAGAEDVSENLDIHTSLDKFDGSARRPTRLRVSSISSADGKRTTISSPLKLGTSSFSNVARSGGYRQWAARTGTLVANMLMAAGADHIITMDLHDAQFQGFFDIPVDNLFGASLIVKYIRKNIQNCKSAVIVSPDAGGAKRASLIARNLRMYFALIHKDRKFTTNTLSQTLPAENLPENSPASTSFYVDHPADLSTEVSVNMKLVGNVYGKQCILIDDIADTSNTIVRAAELLHKHGATKIIAIVTHGILSADAAFKIKESKINEFVVSNTIPQNHHQEVLGNKLKVFDVSELFSEAIRRIHHGESLSHLFEPIHNPE